MKEKSIKFRDHLVKLVMSGEKDATWRLFDDKELSEGDVIDLVNWNTKEVFGEAKLTKVYEKKLGDVEESDFDGHEKYQSEEEMYKTYRTYYGDKVGPETVVKIIRFKPLYVKDSSGNWDTVPPVPEEKMRHVNCHRFILYVLGHMSWEEMTADSKAQREAGEEYIYGQQALSISDEPFTHVDSKESLYSLANKHCDVGRTYIGQVLDTQTGELAHSFLLTKKSDREYSCFDKPGFLYPFKMYELGELLNFVNKDGEKSYQNQKWRFIPLK